MVGFSGRARGVEDVEPGIVNPGGPPLPHADASAGGHPRKKGGLLSVDVILNDSYSFRANANKTFWLPKSFYYKECHKIKIIRIK